MKPTSVNLTNKLKVFSSSTQYNLTCIVAGSVPDTEIRWTQNNRPFKRGTVSRLQLDLTKNQLSYMWLAIDILISCTCGCDHFSNRFHFTLSRSLLYSCRRARAMDASYPLCHFIHNLKTMALCSNVRAQILDYKIQPSRTRSCWMSCVSGIYTYIYASHIGLGETPF